MKHSSTKGQNSTFLPLTQSQLSLWTGQRMNPDVPLHNVVYTFEIFGGIDEAVFEKAFRELIRQTDVLRTVFTERGGIPYQSFRPHTTFNLEIVDFTKVTDQDQIENWVVDRTQRLLKLDERVFDTVLLKLSGDRYLWLLNIHHLVTDAVSHSIIYRRMTSLYKELLDGETNKVPEQYLFSDYIHFEQQQRNDQENEAYRNHWHEKTIEQKEQPILYGKKGNTNDTGATRIGIKLGHDMVSKLKELAERPEIKGWSELLTLFNIFTTVFFTYLYRVSGQNKLTVGAPIHNRTKREFQNTAGLFIEVLPLTLEIEENDTFSSLYDKVGIETNSYLRHARPGVGSTQISRSFNTILNYFTGDFPNFNGMVTDVKWVHNGHMDSAHDLRCHVYDMSGTGELTIAFDLKDGIFGHEVAARYPVHFLNLLDAFLGDIDTPLAKPSVSTDEEQKGLLTHESHVAPSRNSILEYFEDQAAKRPNAVALQYGQETLTYFVLNKKANQLAHFLKRKNIDSNKKVALYFYRSPDYMISVLAVMKTGATFIPIASDQPSERIAFILNNSDCSLTLTEQDLVQNLAPNKFEVLDLSEKKEEIERQATSNLEIAPKGDLAYIIYTSGSTGNPKGVAITHKALKNYLVSAREMYSTDEKSIFGLFTSIGFDLTITSTFLPLICGGRLMIYRENAIGVDTSFLRVLEDQMVNTIKLTPSHLALFAEKNLDNSPIKTMIVGGEDFKVSLAKSIKSSFPVGLKIFNEYGPTEATVGSLVMEYDSNKHTGTSVPIGKPISNMYAYVLDKYKNLAPIGTVGELYLGGTGLAQGYVRLPVATSEKFVENPFVPKTKMYRTGDLARINEHGNFEYHGRTDDQVKLRGYRIELSDIEANLADYPQIDNCTVVLVENQKTVKEDKVVNCVKCGLPSNYPDTDFDENGVCHLCTAFENYKEKTHLYFKNDEQLEALLTSKRGQNPNYDCISLLSGGKDSTYVLARLRNMGLKVLAFTMDNGYISDQAKANIDRIVAELGVDHIYGKTPHMNEIFVDSLKRHHNVCNGCFKTIYTLSTKIALEKKIPFIVTGLSRGQFFETRLTEELFWEDSLNTDKIDNTILEARKIYHQESDAVKRLLDTSMFDDDSVFEKVEFVDFYRFSDVSLEEMMAYLKEKVGWVRPTDTGRSTNCLINQVGIYVHKKELGYSNYSFPYSWDVRLGHKTREESLKEINEVIDEVEVKRIMQEIGYDETERNEINTAKLVAYYTGKPNISIKDLKTFVSKRLPSHMVPTVFKHLDEIPLTRNGKVDKTALKSLNNRQLAMDTPYTAPRNEIEELLEGIWKEVLQLKKIGVHDDFISLGGHSLAAIRVTARINEEIEVDFPLNKVFELPTISEYASYIEKTLTALLEE